MQTYTRYQNASLLILRVVTAAIFYVAAYYKIPYWSSAPEGTSAFMLFTTRLLSIAEPLGATAILFGFLTKWAAAGINHHPYWGNLCITDCLWYWIRNADSSGMEFPTRCACRMFNPGFIWSGQMVN